MQYMKPRTFTDALLSFFINLLIVFSGGVCAKVAGLDFDMRFLMGGAVIGAVFAESVRYYIQNRDYNKTQDSVELHEES